MSIGSTVSYPLPSFPIRPFTSCVPLSFQYVPILPYPCSSPFLSLSYSSTSSSTTPYPSVLSPLATAVPSSHPKLHFPPRQLPSLSSPLLFKREWPIPPRRRNLPAWRWAPLLAAPAQVTSLWGNLYRFLPMVSTPWCGMEICEWLWPWLSLLLLMLLCQYFYD